MSRNGSGTYTLPAGNPVVTGTTIESTWANTTLSDIATTLTDSLSRSGQGGMTAALRIADGTQSAPGVAFANETQTGFYRAGTGEVWAVVQGAQTMNLDANGVTVPSDKATSIEGTFVFNETGADKDARFEGDTDANLLFVDASADAVGIGTSSPGVKLEVAGDARLTGANPSLSAVPTSTGFYIDNRGVGKSTIFRVSSASAIDTTAATLDSSGNLGLGVTPSAWSGSGVKAFDVGTGASFAGSGSDAGMIANAYFNGTNWIYKTSSLAVRYQQLIGTGVHAWYTAPSGTAGNAISFTQAMTLDASGNLLVGTTSKAGGTPAGTIAEFRGGLALSASSAVSGAYQELSFSAGIYTKCSIRGYSTGTTDAGELRFFTAPVGDVNQERARITSGGDLLVGTTDAAATATTNGLICNGTNPGFVVSRRSTGAAQTHLEFRNGGTNVGNITSSTTTTTYATTSDRRLKDNIVPAPSASDVIDAIEIVSHDWKAAPDEHVTYGVIAQDLALVAPQAVLQGDSGDEIEKTWGVDYSKLVPMLIKEIQSLRARVAALEAQ